MQQGRDHEVVSTSFVFFLAQIENNYLQKRVVGTLQLIRKLYHGKLKFYL